MKRREFVCGLTAVVAWPHMANAQLGTRPTVAFVPGTPSAPFKHLEQVFKDGLKDEGFGENENVEIEYRYADNQLQRLPNLINELVARNVAAIIGNNDAAQVAQSITRTIPIVFVTGEDPVRNGLVDNINRPAANLTGITFFGGSVLNAARLKLLQDLVPSSAIIAVLGDANYPAFESELPDLLSAGQSLGRRMEVVKVTGAHDFDPAFEKISHSRASALLVSGSPLFTSYRDIVTSLAAQHKIPTIYDLRELVRSELMVTVDKDVWNLGGYHPSWELAVS